MKIRTKKLSVLLLFLFVTLFSSCEKELYEEPIKKKVKPNVSVQMREVTNGSEVISKLRKKFPTELQTNTTARGAEFF